MLKGSKHAKELQASGSKGCEVARLQENKKSIPATVFINEFKLGTENT